MQAQATRYRWVVLGMVFLAMIINYMDRAALSVAMPFITESFHLTAAEKGMIFSSFFVGYTAFNFIGGWLSDRFGPKRVFGFAMVFWSLLCGLTATAFSFWSLFLLRALFGVGEGPIAATCNKVVNNWFPVSERARAVGFNQAGGPLGGALAGPVIGILSLTLGWRYSFVIVAIIGITWSLVWALLVTDKPHDSRRVNAQEVTLIEAATTDKTIHAGATAHTGSLWSVLFSPQVLAVSAALFCYNYISFFFMTWFPSYLIEARGVSLQGMSLVTALPWLSGAICYASGGVVIDWIYRKTGRAVFSRKLVLVACFPLASVCVALTGSATTPVAAVTLMTLAVGFLMLTAPAYWSLIQDCVPSSHVGVAGGFMNAVGVISGLIGPTVTGFIVGSASGYAGAFMLAGAMGIAGALVVALFVRATPHAAVAATA